MEEKKNWKERLGGYDSMEEAMFVTIDEKTAYAIDELKEFIQQELDKAREEGRKEVLKEVEYALAKDLRYELRFTEIQEVLSKLKQ